MFKKFKVKNIFSVLMTALTLCVIMPMAVYADAAKSESEGSINWVFLIVAIALGLFLGLMGRSK